MQNIRTGHVHRDSLVSDMKLRWNRRPIFLGYVFHGLTVSASCVVNSLKTGAGRVQVAQSLLSLLPPELTSIAEPEGFATESSLPSVLRDLGDGVGFNGRL